MGPRATVRVFYVGLIQIYIQIHILQTQAGAKSSLLDTRLLKTSGRRKSQVNWRHFVRMCMCGRVHSCLYHVMFMFIFRFIY